MTPEDHLFIPGTVKVGKSASYQNPPLEITIEGTTYLVQRQPFSPIAIMRADGGRMVAGERHLVLAEFIAQQHRRLH